MRQLEENIINSFRLAKSDIIKLQNSVIELRKSQQSLIQRISQLEKDKEVKAAQRNHVRKSFVASKEANKFHNVNCPFAQNIKPKSKIVFKSKVKALNEGYKPCKCVK